MPDSETARPPADPGDTVIGSLLGGRYRVLNAIGRGGMATVYRAADSQLPREVAVKLMSPDSADAAELRRQHTEIDTLAALNHYALVGLIDAGVEHSAAGDRAFLVMELVDGPTLRDVRPAPLAPEEVAHIGADIAEALHYMHGKGIVHRDIKPANILLAGSDLPDRSFHAKLADLGIARLVDGARLTSTGVVLGTANYLSPEQARGSSVGPATDVYSLGLVILEALTGQVAFPGPRVEALSARLLHPPALPDSIDPGWRDLLTRMTAMDPSARPLPMEVAVTARNRANASRRPAPDQWAAPDQRTGSDERIDRVEPTVPTRMLPISALPAGNEPESLTQVMTAADPGTGQEPDGTNRHQRPSERRLGRIFGWIAAAVIVAAAAGGALVWSTAPSQTPTPAPSYPAVAGTLGTHLKQLQQSVTP